jgi:uncharacterized protein (DUF885 family)
MFGDDGAAAGAAGTATTDQNAGKAESQNDDANAGGGESQNQGGGDDGLPKTADDFQRWKDATRKDIARDLRAQIKDELKRDADAKAAKDAGNYKELADKYEAEIETLREELESRDRQSLRERIAVKHKLPADLAIRLRGETEAELEDDAKTLAKLVTARPAPDTEAGSGRKGTSGPSDRPIEKKVDPKNPPVTFDGKPIAAWPHLTQR